MPQGNTERTRDASIDALKGLATFLVVVGHAIPFAAAVFHDGPGLVRIDPLWVPLTTATDPVFNLLGAFHMPLFAFLSGLVLCPADRRPLRHQVLRRFRGLMVPYFAWFFLGYVMPRPSASNAPRDVISGFLHVLSGRGGLWYLYALFICAVVVSCIALLKGSRWLLPASALFAVGFSTELLFRVPDVMYLKQVLWIYPFVVLGYCVSRYRSTLARHRLPLALTTLIAFGPLYYMLYPVHVAQLRPNVEPIAVAMHDLGVPGGYVLSIVEPYLIRYLTAAAAVLFLYALYTGSKGRIIDAQAWLGRKSLGIFAVHSGFLWWMVNAGQKNALVLTAASLAMSAALVGLLERVPVVDQVLLGKIPSARPVATTVPEPPEGEETLAA